MQKLRSTTSKNTFTAIQDIFEIHGVYSEHSVVLNKHSKNQYNIFVHDEEVEKAEKLLVEKLWEESKLDYSIMGNDILKKEYVSALYESDEKKEIIEQLLLERRVTDDELQQLIDIETEKGYEQKYIKPLTIIWAILFVIFTGGLFTAFIGIYLHQRKKLHPFTEEKMYMYDSESRKYGLVMLIFGLLFFYVFIKSL